MRALAHVLFQPYLHLRKMVVGTCVLIVVQLTRLLSDIDFPYLDLMRCVRCDGRFYYFFKDGS